MMLETDPEKTRKWEVGIVRVRWGRIWLAPVSTTCAGEGAQEGDEENAASHAEDEGPHVTQANVDGHQIEQSYASVL